MRRFFETPLASPRVDVGVAQVRLVLLGACRDACDDARVAALQQRAAALGVAAHVEFVLNGPFHGPGGIVAWLKKADVRVELPHLDTHAPLCFLIIRNKSKHMCICGFTSFARPTAAPSF